MEAWLDEHPEFFQDYLIRKGGRGMIDAWLVSHALPPGINTTANTGNEDPSLANATDDGGGSGNTATNSVPQARIRYASHAQPTTLHLLYICRRKTSFN